MKPTNMHIDDVEIVVVSYNSSELIMDLLSSLRKHYSNTVHIIDGSDAHIYSSIEAVCNQFESVHFKHFEYNIHHGPGMAWAINNIQFKGPVLFLDSDIVVLKNGFIESMLQQLKPNMYGVGSVSYTNESGFDVDYYTGAIPYLHPACMLCNIEVMKEWPLPIKHGAPMIEAMYELHKNHEKNLIKNIAWINHDFGKSPEKNFLQHDWQGTVKNSGGYNLDEWETQARADSNLLNLILGQIPNDARKIIHIGCDNGSLARAFKEKYPSCYFIGIEEDLLLGEMAKEFCDVTLVGSLDKLDSNILQLLKDADVWLITKMPNDMHDPKSFLTKIKPYIRHDSCLIMSIKNMQNWEYLFHILAGKKPPINYPKLNKNINILTRTSVLEMGDECGFSLTGGYQLTSQTTNTDQIQIIINSISSIVGTSAETAIQDVFASHYVFKFEPKNSIVNNGAGVNDFKKIINF